MIAFEVSVNGRRVCLAGIAGPSVMTALVDWIERRPGDHPDATLPQKALELNVGGLDSRSGEHLKWVHESVPVGSDILIRVVEVEKADEPTDRRAKDEVSEMRCAFCNKLRSEVARLIAGRGANICNECVEVCVEELKP